MVAKITCCFLTLTVFISHADTATSDYFTAAVYEHVLHDNWVDKAVSPVETVLSNLGYYERAITVAKEQGADLIIFPEYGFFSPMYDRNHVKNFLEFIPDPNIVTVTPCTKINQYLKRPILFALSCLAKSNKIVVVANMGGREPCHGLPDCPEDGEYHFNANVAFDQNGTLVGRYYKEHLFYESAMDLPKHKQDHIVETNFGKFAMFICFDILFKEMVEVSHRTDIDAILFSALWLTMPPFLSSIQWFQAWAMGNNVTLLAANLQLPGYLATGSGIFRGLDGSVINAFNSDGIPKLVIATVPKRGKKISPTTKVIAITENETKEWNDNGKDLPAVCSHRYVLKSKVVVEHYCFNENLANYTLEKLTESEGHVKVCNNGMCCELNYSADSMNEHFFLGVFNGTRPFFEKYFFSEENCFLARCDDVNGSSCSHFVLFSETLFHRISMKANFSSTYVYPSVMSSGMQLVPVHNWTFTPETNRASIELNSRSGIPLLQATLMGRPYDKDPPYIR